MPEGEDTRTDNAVAYDYSSPSPSDAAEAKGSRFSRGIIKILTYVAAALIGVLLVVTTTFISVKLINRKERARDYVKASGEYLKEIEVLQYMSSIPQIRGRTADVTPHSLVVKVELGYARDDRAVQSELVARTPQLTDLVRGFFGQKTASELAPDKEQKIKDELKGAINRILSSGRIENVVFTEFQIYAF